MPIIQINIQEGRSVEQRRRLVYEVTQAVVRALEVKPEAVRIMINELHAENYGLAGITAGEVPLKERNRNIPGVDG